MMDRLTQSTIITKIEKSSAPSLKEQQNKSKYSIFDLFRLVKSYYNFKNQHNIHKCSIENSTSRHKSSIIPDNDRNNGVKNIGYVNFDQLLREQQFSGAKNSDQINCATSCCYDYHDNLDAKSQYNILQLQPPKANNGADVAGDDFYNVNEKNNKIYYRLPRSQTRVKKPQCLAKALTATSAVTPTPAPSSMPLPPPPPPPPASSSASSSAASQAPLLAGSCSNATTVSTTNSNTKRSSLEGGRATRAETTAKPAASSGATTTTGTTTRPSIRNATFKIVRNGSGGSLSSGCSYNSSGISSGGNSCSNRSDAGWNAEQPCKDDGNDDNKSHAEKIKNENSNNNIRDNREGSTYDNNNNNNIKRHRQQRQQQHQQQYFVRAYNNKGASNNMDRSSDSSSANITTTTTTTAANISKIYYNNNDPHDSPQTPPTMKTIREDELITVVMEKKERSLGFTIHNLEGQFYIKELVREPALSDGRIKPGDQILLVNGCDISTMTHSEAVNFLRSQPQQVKLVLKRPEISDYDDLSISDLDDIVKLDVTSNTTATSEADYSGYDDHTGIERYERGIHNHIRSANNINNNNNIDDDNTRDVDHISSNNCHKNNSASTVDISISSSSEDEQEQALRAQREREQRPKCSRIRKQLRQEALIYIRETANLRNSSGTSRRLSGSRHT